MKKVKPTLLEAIKSAAWNGVELYACANAKVLSVDENTYTANVGLLDEDEMSVSYSARLRSCTIDDSKGFIIVPVIGSIISIGFLDLENKETVVIKESEIDKVIINCTTSLEIKITNSNTSNISINETGIVFGEDGNEPFVRGNKLKSWAQDVDSKIETLINWAGTGKPPGETGGIAPLVGVMPSEFDEETLSEKYKMI
ncbi:MAG: hypothetical protein JXK07_09955 [Spirochaetes bacterium]|nr:hypothetical protein [Spirochaetota bacterium]MBN2771279.1 hypothetical protein [Spirochaetota bacterium]